MFLKKPAVATEGFFRGGEGGGGGTSYPTKYLSKISQI